MSDSATETLLALRARIQRLKAQRGKGIEPPPEGRVYTITDRVFGPLPWPPSEAELVASGRTITRHCAEGCGDIIDSAPPCPHEREALDNHHGPSDRADFGNYHHQEIDP